MARSGFYSNPRYPLNLPSASVGIYFPAPSVKMTFETTRIAFPQPPVPFSSNEQWTGDVLNSGREVVLQACRTVSEVFK